MATFLFISLMNSDSWGGSEELWYKTAAYCVGKNDAVTCLVYHWEEKENKLQLLKERGATILYIPNRGRKKKNFFQKLRYELITRFQQKQYINHIRFSDFDFVLVNQGGFMEVTNNPWRKLFKKINNYSVTYHNYIESFVFKPKKATILKSWMEHAKHNFFASNNGCKCLEQQLDNYVIPNQTVFINPITIPLKQTYTEYKLTNGQNFKMVVLASLDIDRKAQDNLIKALSTEKWKHRNWVLEIYGQGKDFSVLQNLIQSLTLNEKVMLMGNTDNVAEVLEAANLVLQITHMDAMPISVVEAMSRSRAVVVSNVGDMPLWIKNFQTGWVTENATIQNIDKVLEIAWENRSKWEQIGKNAFDFFIANFPISAEATFYNLIAKKVQQ